MSNDFAEELRQMKVKDLEEIRCVQKRMPAWDEELARLRSEAERVTQALSGMPRSATRKHTAREDAIVKLLEVLQAKLETVERHRARVLEARAAIVDRLDDARQCFILDARYLQAKTWGAIATELGYSRKYVWLLYKQAALKFDEGDACKRA